MPDLADVAGDVIDRGMQSLVRAHVERTDKVSAEECEECGNKIPEGRRLAVRGTQHCIDCADYFERKAV